ncbi:hypothetical protein A2U01_0102060, partial [Trifolium medium]|nr:hypothetical protein [Trifolium medium]
RLAALWLAASRPCLPAEAV